jgi:hypothetical protein
MARGFDSKSVTDQQEEAEQAKDRPEPLAPPASPQRRKLELARIDLLRRMDAAPESRRAEMRTSLDALEAMIRDSR